MDIVLEGRFLANESGIFEYITPRELDNGRDVMVCSVLPFNIHVKRRVSSVSLSISMDRRSRSFGSAMEMQKRWIRVCIATRCDTLQKSTVITFGKCADCTPLYKTKQGSRLDP